jgi:hypothetical protein
LSLDVVLRYFMRELLSLGALDKPQLPVFLTSWVDKSSALCMYTMIQTCTWSVPHLKAGCWYIDCGKIYYPVEEEDVKKASKGAALGFDHGEEQEEEVEVDLNLLSEKERNKILFQRTRDAKKATEKAEKEALKAKEKAVKEAKKGERGVKSKVVAAPIPPLLLIKTSTTSSSQNPCKQVASLS